MMRSVSLWIIGFGILFLNKLRYAVKGYTQPKPFDSSDAPRAIAYDRSIVDKWESALKIYLKRDDPFRGQSILELGPGSDMGVGAILLDRGATSYVAFDKNPLMTKPTDAFAAELVKVMENGVPKLDQVQFVHDPAFQIATLKPHAPFSLIVSQAAFEHFDDPNATIRDLRSVTSTGAVLCAEIDLKAHSRWIVDRDPNNIYRFPTWLYRMLHYAGIPNRVRPEQYVAFLKDAGWSNIQMIPLKTSQNKNEPTFGSFDLHVLECLIIASRDQATP